MIPIDLFIHPEDREALSHLKSIPLAPKLMKQIMRFYDENLTYGRNMGQKIRLSPTQLPHIYNLLPPICEILDIPEPEFYLKMNPEPNAYAMGENRPNITLYSGLLELMTEDEVRAVIAHECGHIACHHMLYTTMINYMLEEYTSRQFDKDLLSPIMCALLYWNRKSELSCDRIAAYVTSPEAVINFLSRFAGGSSKIMFDFNIEEFAQQTEKYKDIRSKDFWNKLLQSYGTLNCDHPFVAVRVNEILKWTNSEEFINLKANIPMCPHCHSAILKDWKFCKKCGTPLICDNNE